LTGAVQTRFLDVALTGRSGTYVLTGDQAGYSYAINAQTGAIVWRGNAGGPIGDRVYAPPAVQLNSYANAAFQTANPSRDLIYYATYNNSTTNNRVFALSSVDGSQVWAFSPGNKDITPGGMLVDYTNNRLWVTSYSNGGTQPSVWVINTLTGALVTSYNLGDIDYGVNKDWTANQAVIATKAGTVYGFDLTNLGSAIWSTNIGSQTAYAYPIGNGFIASLSSGSVQRYSVDPTTHVVATVWASAPAITNPTGIRIDYTNQKLYVGDGAGKVHRVDLATGTDEGQLTVSSTAVGTPTIDTSLFRLHVGTQDGRVCAFGLPF
jgi:hypothetical protein